MTIHVNIGEAKTRLSELVAAAVRGETVVIAKAGKPVVRLALVGSQDVEKKHRRLSAFGMFKHAYDPALVDALLEPMSEEELALWYDSPLFPEGDADSAPD